MGLRERKKEKTRLAILDAALDLFLEQGYESTTIEQIAGVVEVSPRTFFRYFTSKDHLVLWFHDHGEEVLLETFAGRPEDEPPFTSLMHGLRAMVDDMKGSTPEDTERFLKLRQLFDKYPHLVGLSVARGAVTERRLAEAVAARRGVSPEDDQLSHLIVAFAMSTMRVGFECPRREGDIADIMARIASAVALAEAALRPGWDSRPAA
ncbi:MAG: TetR family transcriptional regulator [Nonomuraea sp.]|nr:TetR family transcriptional regulator [Nonomuraea sp.]